MEHSEMPLTLANSQFVTGERSCFLSQFWVTDYESDVQNALTGQIFFQSRVEKFRKFHDFKAFNGFFTINRHFELSGLVFKWFDHIEQTKYDM